MSPSQIICLHIANLGKGAAKPRAGLWHSAQRLSEFISNAAHEYALASTPGRTIHVTLHQGGEPPVGEIVGGASVWSADSSTLCF
jgi:hypothetical protein